jgi:hypothetical protein
MTTTNVLMSASAGLDDTAKRIGSVLGAISAIEDVEALAKQVHAEGNNEIMTIMPRNMPFAVLGRRPCASGLRMMPGSEMPDNG